MQRNQVLLGVATLTLAGLAVALRACDAAEVLKRTGVPFMVGFNRRFDPGHRAVREAVMSGRIGDVRMH